MKTLTYTFLTIFLLSSFSSLAFAQKKWGSGIDFSARATNREKSRWSLTDWLAMKDRNRMMDMWLSVHSPSPFEFCIGAGYLSYQTLNVNENTSATHTTYSGKATAHAQFVGLTAEYLNNSSEGYSDLAGMFNVRILGNSLQNTGLTLHLGQKTRQTVDEDNLVQAFGQVTLQVYLTKYFGFSSQYRKYLPTSTNSLGDVDEDIVEAELFIDFKGIRIYGSWFQETQKRKESSLSETTEIQRSGLKSGLKFFF